MSEEAFRGLVGAEIRDALTYIDSDVAPKRQINYQYFMGDMPDVPSVPGRSAVVVRVVADYIDFILPSLLRTMIAGKKVIEYISKGTQDEEAAKQATDFVNETVLRLDNHIENTSYGWGFDGLVNKVGILKVWWEEEKETEDFNVQVPFDPQGLGLTMAVQQAQSQGLEITGHAQDPQTGAHHLQLRKTTDKSHVKFDVIPPEEFVCSRDARTLETSRLLSHRSYKYVGDLIEQGYDRDVVMRLPTYQDSISTNSEAQTRQPGVIVYATPQSGDPMLKKVAVHEGTVLCNKDGTGLKRWYFVAGGWGSHIEILECKPFEDEFYFCDFCPIPVPHLFFGRCPADDLIEIQKIQTVLARQVQDSAYLSLAPQREVIVNNIVGGRIEYVQNMSPGAIIPVSAPAVNNIEMPFVGEQVLPLMQYWDAQSENRTGTGRTQAGLDPEILQNQSATAASLQDSASKLKLETVARIWAAGGMRKLGRAILRILKRRMDFARMVKMNGVETQVDPRMWAELEDWDVAVNTGLGTGNREKDVAVMQAIVAKMEQILLQLGPDNPIVTVPMYCAALQDLAELSGAHTPSKYFNTLPRDWQPPPQPKQPDPKVQVAQIQAGATIEAAQIKAGVQQNESQLDNLISYLLGIREQNLEAHLKAAEIATNHTHNQNMANIKKVEGQKRALQ